MVNLLQHPGFGAIRVEKEGSDFIFCAKDVCDAPGMEWKGYGSLGSLDDDEKVRQKVRTPGGQQEMQFVTESGLYALIIIKEQQAAGREFRRWITGEVLPALRRTGYYGVKRGYCKRKRIGGNVQTVEMLWLINEHPDGYSRGVLAMEPGVTRQTVHGVLTGRIRSARVLSGLYQKALENKKPQAFNPYFHVEKMIEKLK